MMLDIWGIRAMSDGDIEKLEEEIEHMLRNYPLSEQVEIRTGVTRWGADAHEILCREKCVKLREAKETLARMGG